MRWKDHQSDHRAVIMANLERQMRLFEDFERGARPGYAGADACGYFGDRAGAFHCAAWSLCSGSRSRGWFETPDLDREHVISYLMDLAHEMQAQAKRAAGNQLHAMAADRDALCQAAVAAVDELAPDGLTFSLPAVGGE